MSNCHGASLGQRDVTGRFGSDPMPPVKESVLADLKSGMMYWHGRDRSCRPVLVNALKGRTSSLAMLPVFWSKIWRMEKISKFDADRATRTPHLLACLVEAKPSQCEQVISESFL